MDNKVKELFVEFGATIITSHFNVGRSIAALKDLGAEYGMDMDAVEAALRKSNAEEVAKALLAEGETNLMVRSIGEVGFHLSQLASCVYDESTGLDIVEPIGDALSLLIVIEKVQELENDF